MMNEQGGRERNKEPRGILFPLFDLLIAPPLVTTNHKPDGKGICWCFQWRAASWSSEQTRGDWRGELEGQQNRCPRDKLDQEGMIRLAAFLWWAGMGKCSCFLSEPTYPVMSLLWIYFCCPRDGGSSCYRQQRTVQAASLQTFNIKYINQGLRSKNKQEIGPHALLRVQ